MSSLGNCSWHMLDFLTLSITGLGSPGLISPCGLAMDSSGNLYIADTGNSRIVEVSPSGAGSVISTSSITLNAPQGVAVDVSGDIYISDTGNSRIVKIPSGGTAAVFTISGLTRMMVVSRRQKLTMRRRQWRDWRQVATSPGADPRTPVHEFPQSVVLRRCGRQGAGLQRAVVHFVSATGCCHSTESPGRGERPFALGNRDALWNIIWTASCCDRYVPSGRSAFDLTFVFLPLPGRERRRCVKAQSADTCAR